VTYRHSVSVAAVVVREDERVLAIRRRDNNEWQIPGGVLELEETAEAGLARETREETGLGVKPERLAGIYKHMRLGVVALVFRCALNGEGQETLSDETAEIGWLTAAEVQERMPEVFAIRVRDALADDGATHVRAHDGTRMVDEGGLDAF
jgi:ADP-ribose pyrophosphatase YjhB (NUDIX family)